MVPSIVDCFIGGFAIEFSGVQSSTDFLTRLEKEATGNRARLTSHSKRMLALPSPIGGLQTGCATDGTSIFSNGIDALRLGAQEKQADSAVPPTGGRVAI